MNDAIERYLDLVSWQSISEGRDDHAHMRPGIVQIDHAIIVFRYLWRLQPAGYGGQSNIKVKRCGFRSEVPHTVLILAIKNKIP
ncbi:hypothetical protein D3C76_1654230 [compost metagenome]